MAGGTAEVQQRATQAISGIATALTDITQELHNVQQQLQYWRVEADAWKARYEQERTRNDRLRRVLRCTPLNATSSGLSAQPSLTNTPKALRGTSSAIYTVPSTGACGPSSSAGAAAATPAQQAACSSTLQQQQTGASLNGTRSSTGVKSPLSSPLHQHQQQQQQQPAGWSSVAVGSSSSCGTLSPPRQQQHSFTQQRQQLRPLKCVPEGQSSSSSSTSELTQQQGVARQAGSTDTPTTAAAAAAAAAAAGSAPAGSDSPSADPFANYVGPVSDPGEPVGLRNQQPGLRNALQPQRSSDMGMGAHLQQDRSVSADPTATAAADVGAVSTFRRSRTMSIHSSFSAVQSPSFAAGFGPGSFLHQAASWMPPAAQGPGQSRHTVDQLLRVMMAFTLMQGAAGDTDEQQTGEGPDEDILPSVSLDDDDGSSGVGLAAAAAVSAAMARAWATAASREQRAVAAAAGGGQGGGKVAGREPGGSSSGRAGFRLVATVTNKMGKRQASTSALSSYASQDSITGLDSSTADLASLGRDQPGAAAAAATPSPKPPGLPASKLSSSSSSLARSASGTADAIGAATAAAAAAADGSSSPFRQLPAAAAGGSSPVKPAVSSGAAKSAAAPAAGAAPNSSQATTISLQWLSRPRTVLVMRKLAPSTEAAFLRALDWLRRHQVTIIVEPKVFQELVDAGRVIPLAPSQQQQQQQASKATTSSSGKADADNGSSVSVSGGSPSLAHTGSSSSLAGMLISTTQAAPQSGLFPVNSWAGPSSGSSSGGSSAAAAAAGGGGVVGAGGAAAGVIKTWQPELQVDQTQEVQQNESGSNGSSSSMVQANDLIPDAVAQQLDLVVVLGGDGTVLWTCHIFGNRSVPPLVPFNLGSLGFLTPFDPARLEQVLLKTFRGGFPIMLRHRLHCTIVRCSTSCPAPTPGSTNSSGGSLPSVSNQCVGHCVYGEEHVSLNEVVIERGISPFLTNLECFCDGTFVTHVQGDGLIVGTPTGSTAYSLAAGGSMVHPQVPCILFTPICPHSLSFRPLMFPDYVQLCVQVPANARGHVWASFDGKDRTQLGPGDAVVIRLSKWPVPSVAAEADPSSDWFSAVRECLHWNMRKVQGGAGQ